MATLVDEQLKPLLERRGEHRAGHTADPQVAARMRGRRSRRQGVFGAAATAAAGRSTATHACGDRSAADQQIDTMLGSLPPSLDAATLVQLLLSLLGSKPRDRFFQLNLPVVDDLLDPLHTLSAWSDLDSAGVAAHVVASIDTLSARVRESAAVPLAGLAVSLECRGAAVAARRR